MWMNLKERFANVTRTSIFQMKTDLQNMKKGLESIDQYLQKIKDSRDQLSAVGVLISDEDVVILAP
ncbi:PREDICTED: LOW QUALITY PROTEIN [Prunus dulcis]|uniref:PREDICTED: LOW QUALITY PROTEIN n=1 Tax=Prunus dulcis TaxID=3755 RepID=A0A5E4EG78_PRUDU|nr:PREDICTED: LOW QUALITY PROTEIN [Prunus dulcis]